MLWMPVCCICTFFRFCYIVQCTSIHNVKVVDVLYLLNLFIVRKMGILSNCRRQRTSWSPANADHQVLCFLQLENIDVFKLLLVLLKSKFSRKVGSFIVEFVMVLKDIIGSTLVVRVIHYQFRRWKQFKKNIYIYQLSKLFFVMKFTRQPYFDLQINPCLWVIKIDMSFELWVVCLVFFMSKHWGTHFSGLASTLNLFLWMMIVSFLAADAAIVVRMPPLNTPREGIVFSDCIHLLHVEDGHTHWFQRNTQYAKCPWANVHRSWHAHCRAWANCGGSWPYYPLLTMVGKRVLTLYRLLLGNFKVSTTLTAFSSAFTLTYTFI